MFINIYCCNESNPTLRKEENQNGSPRIAIWLSITQLSEQLHFGATLDYEEKKTAFSYKREPIFANTPQESHIDSLCFLSVGDFAPLVY